MKVYKILGKRRRITVPKKIRRELGLLPNDILSFSVQNGDEILIKRERVGDDFSLTDFLDSLSEPEKYAALVYLTAEWAEWQDSELNDDWRCEYETEDLSD